MSFPVLSQIKPQAPCSTRGSRGADGLYLKPGPEAQTYPRRVSEPSPGARTPGGSLAASRLITPRCARTGAVTRRHGAPFGGRLGVVPSRVPRQFEDIARRGGRLAEVAGRATTPLGAAVGGRVLNCGLPLVVPFRQFL